MPLHTLVTASALAGPCVWRRRLDSGRRPGLSLHPPPPHAPTGWGSWPFLRQRGCDSVGRASRRACAPPPHPPRRDTARVAPPPPAAAAGGPPLLVAPRAGSGAGGRRVHVLCVALQVGAASVVSTSRRPPFYPRPSVLPARPALILGPGALYGTAGGGRRWWSTATVGGGRGCSRAPRPLFIRRRLVSLCSFYFLPLIPLLPGRASASRGCPPLCCCLSSPLLRGGGGGGRTPPGGGRRAAPRPPPRVPPPPPPAAGGGGGGGRRQRPVAGSGCASRASAAYDCSSPPSTLSRPHPSSVPLSPRPRRVHTRVSWVLAISPRLRHLPKRGGCAYLRCCSYQL